MAMTIDKIGEIQRLLTEIRMDYDNDVRIREEYEEIVSEYKKDISYLNRVCDEQTMELQRANKTLERYENEIKRLREEEL